METMLVIYYRTILGKGESLVVFGITKKSLLDAISVNKMIDVEGVLVATSSIYKIEEPKFDCVRRFYARSKEDRKLIELQIGGDIENTLLSMSVSKVDNLLNKNQKTPIIRSQKDTISLPLDNK